MKPRAPLTFETRTIDEFRVEDERSFRGIALYEDLKGVLQKDRYPFRMLPKALAGRWDRALLLNLTYWGANEGGDVLSEDLAADVVTHVAWHHLAARALLPKGRAPSVDALFLGEAIASAFDVYLVGRLLLAAPKSSFLATQVPAMAEAAMGAGLPESDFEALLQAMADAPERAFEELRELLFDATSALFASASAEEAMQALSAFDAHRFAPLLHRYELSNWVLYARAYGDAAPDEAARQVDRALREKKDEALTWLTAQWLSSS